MRIYEFIDKFCSDLVKDSKTSRSLIALDGLPNDDIVEDEEGVKIPIIYVDGGPIPVEDFITMNRDDFLRIWTSAGAAEAFDNYVSALTILEGEDAVNKIRNCILAEAERLSHDVELVTSI